MDVSDAVTDSVPGVRMVLSITSAETVLAIALIDSDPAPATATPEPVPPAPEPPKPTEEASSVVFDVAVTVTPPVAFTVDDVSIAALTIAAIVLMARELAPPAATPAPAPPAPAAAIAPASASMIDVLDATTPTAATYTVDAVISASVVPNILLNENAPARTPAPLPPPPPPMATPP